MHSENLNANILSCFNWFFFFFFILHLQLSSPEKPTEQNIKTITPRISFPDVNWTKSIFNLSITDRHIHISDKIVQSWRGDTALTDLTDKAVALRRGDVEGRAGDSVTRKWWLEHLGWEPTNTYFSSNDEDWHWNLHWLLFSIVSIWRKQANQKVSKWKYQVL